MRASDEETFVEFVAGSTRTLRRTAYLMTGDWHRADDVVQSAMVKMYVAWPRLVRTSGMHAYARRAVVTGVIDEGRRPWRRERSTEVVESDANVADGATGVENRMVLLNALRSLPARQRATVVLRYYDDLSVEETAEILGCTPGTVKSQTARGLEGLRVLLAAAGVAEPISVGEDVA